MNPHIVVESHCLLGEAPTWHAGERCIYWTDINGRTLHRFHPESGIHSIAMTGQLVAGITIETDGALLLLGRWGGLHRFQDRSVHALRRMRPRQLGFRFNDVIVDPAGRVLAGTLAYESGLAQRFGIRPARRWLQQRGVLSAPEVPTGALWRISAGGAMVPIASGLHRPNGMAFSSDLTTLYVTESRSRRIYAYRYDVELGLLSDARVFLDLSDEPGTPDGLVVDCEGCLWSARHKAGVVVRYAADGREIARVCFPTPAITSLAFGGIDNRDLYVTAGGADDPATNGDFAGALFCFRSPAEGGPVWDSRIGHA